MAEPISTNKLMIYKFIAILIFFISIDMFSQENKELKKFRCFKDMPQNMDGIEAMDTIFVIYQKSEDKKYIQGKGENINGYKQYYFMNTLVFPILIFDYQDWKRVNIRQSKIMFKKKSYICKNMYRTIDVKFLYNWELRFSVANFKKNTVFFIVELDTEVKCKYKIIQVNWPEFIVE